jgi:hypothetical protein
MAEEWRKANVEVSGLADFDYGKREGSDIDSGVTSSGSAQRSERSRISEAG